MKHAPNGREESKTARDWDPRIHEEKSIANSRRTSTFNNWYRRVHEATQCDQAARRVCADVPGDASRTVWCVSRASDVLEMIQQKSMHRKSETRRSHSLQQSRRRRMKTNVTRTFAEFRCYATGHRTAVQERQRDMWIRYHTVELEVLPRTTITPWQSITQWCWRLQCAAQWQIIQRERERDRLCVQSSTDIFQSKDNGEQKIHDSTKDRVKRKGTR